MEPYQKILVGINYTDSSRHALQQAHRIAQESGGTLTAIHVVPPESLDDHILFFYIEHKAIMRSALDSLKKFVTEILGPDHKVVCDTRKGAPHHELAEVVQERQIDLLVLGTNEEAKNPHRAGALAIKCLRDLETPVILVRNQGDRPFAHLSACVDFSASTTAVLENTGKMLFGKDQVVEVLHANRPPWLREPYILYASRPPEDEKRKTQYRKKIEDQLQGTVENASDLLPLPPTPVMLEGEFLEQVILNHLKDSGTELAIVGRWGSGAKGLKTIILGGTAEALIRHAKCSVLVVPVAP